MELLSGLLVLAIPALLSWPLGKYMAFILDNSHCPGKIAGIIGGGITRKQQDWKEYALTMMLVNVLMFAIVTVILAFQQALPLNPDGKTALEASLIFNTVSSFVTNTNLQHYSGEVFMSYFSQLFGLMWLQFVSAATGIACLAALARGLAGRTMMGNFYRDLSAATFLILLPLAL
ncbi:MAG: potassium-transporting ATPase subunit KdpA, partial [Chlorobiaceae bacterium]|nr:potassium-transporting ATPase subunit KdpA [Chlorobiaceae bacterium]